MCTSITSSMWNFEISKNAKNLKLKASKIKFSYFLLRQVDPRLLKSPDDLQVHKGRESFSNIIRGVCAYHFGLLFCSSGQVDAAPLSVIPYPISTWYPRMNVVKWRWFWQSRITNFQSSLINTYQIHGWVFPAFSYHGAKTSKVLRISRVLPLHRHESSIKIPYFLSSHAHLAGQLDYHNIPILSPSLDWTQKNEDKTMSTTAQNVPGLEETDIVPGTFLLIRGEAFPDSN